MACEVLHPRKENLHGLCVFGNYAISDKIVTSFNTKLICTQTFVFLKGVNTNAY